MSNLSEHRPGGRKAMVWIGTILMATAALSADPIVIGSSQARCETEKISELPWTTPSFVPSETPTPKECAVFSGAWVGTCYDGIVRPVETGPNGEPVYTSETVLPESVVVPEGIENATPLLPVHTIHVQQEGCRKVLFTSEEGPFKNLPLDLENTLQQTGFLRFRRSCVNGFYSWDRTYDMHQFAKTISRWSPDAQLVHVRAETSGSDTNYGASFRQIRKSRIYTQDGGSRLRIESASWGKRQKYDPAGLGFDPANIGGFVCVFKK